MSKERSLPDRLQLGQHTSASRLVDGWLLERLVAKYPSDKKTGDLSVAGLLSADSFNRLR
jgi:hypothetical protein